MLFKTKVQANITDASININFKYTVTIEHLLFSEMLQTVSLSCGLSKDNLSK